MQRPKQHGHNMLWCEGSLGSNGREPYGVTGLGGCQEGLFFVAMSGGWARRNRQAAPCPGPYKSYTTRLRCSTISLILQ
jgi:hypothetical protein